MTDRLLVDLGADGRVWVSTWLDSELPGPVGEPGQLVWPLDDEAMEQLRWYLEDYLRVPFGVYEGRGPRVAARLTEWGQAVFGSIFGPGQAHDAYVRLRARGRPAEIVFRSSAAGPLALPWELMWDPSRPSPLALDQIAVSRSLPAAELADAFPVAGDRLRVLMVISRPRGTADVGYRMIARPLLDRLEAVRGTVDLVVLRPPTLDALDAALTAARLAGQQFQVVHFDGHGVLPRQPPGAGWGPAVTLHGPAAQGMLTFEKPGGGSDEVQAADVARVLAAAQVPVAVLNACQSGAVGKQLEAAVATRLLQEGVACVVAMAYTVYAVAAAEFMAAFYERLFAGDRVAQAVVAGRRRLAQRNKRPSPKGTMPLADWLVPVHYARRDVHFPALPTRRSAALSLEEMLDRLRDRGPQDALDSLASDGPFVGRDGLFYSIEVAARLNKVVLLHGPGGAGKTELAKAFGRWWRDTGGVDRPEWVIRHSFEPGVASFELEGLLAEIGVRVFGVEFTRRDAAERREVVLELLSTRRLLLILDNFESVYTMPGTTKATPPLGEDGREELRQFLGKVATAGPSGSAVVITSRTDEQWLGSVRRIQVSGLAPHEATEYADELLAAYPDAWRRRARPAFADLMNWLDGHPLSMRLVLPHLDTTDPEALLAGLRGVVVLPGVDDGGRTTSLTASVAYSFDHLTAEMRQLLVAVSLFHRVADISALSVLAGLPDAPVRLRGHTADEWRQVLDRAAAVGLLTPLGKGLYRIHPALQSFLAARWRDDDPETYDQQRVAADRALLDAYSARGGWLLRQIEAGDAAAALTDIDLQRPTLGGLLANALENRLWQQAEAIAQPLMRYWIIKGLAVEANAWVDRARLVLEDHDGTPPSLDTAAGALWLFLVGAQANWQLRALQLDQADHTYLRIRDMLQHQPESPTQLDRLAVVHYQLGICAQHRGRLDGAEDWYRKSLTIFEQLGNRHRMASSYRQLGVVARLRGRRDGADDWYRKSLTIFEQLGDQPGMASCYLQLGTVALNSGSLDKADTWLRRYVAIEEQLGDRFGMATGYHQLGTVALLHGRLDDAEDWYQQSMIITEQLGHRPDMANIYHQLGIVAQFRGHLDDAEDWYQRSLTIEVQLDNRPGMAQSFAQLGILATARGQQQRALEWMVKCVALFDEVPHSATEPGPGHLARLTAKLGMPTLERCWRHVTGKPLPQAVRDHVQATQEEI